MDSAENWICDRREHGDIREVDPTHEEIVLEIFTIADNCESLSQRCDTTKTELDTLPKKLESAAKALLERQLGLIRAGDCAGDPEQHPDYQRHLKSIDQWKSDKYEVKQKAYLVMVDEQKSLENKLNETIYRLISKVHATYMADMKSSTMPTTPGDIPDDVDAELFKELADHFADLTQVGVQDDLNL